MVDDMLVLSETYRDLKCQIFTNTNITSYDIVNVLWYKRIDAQKASVKNRTGGVLILQTVSITNMLFVSKLRFTSTQISSLGIYTCVAWIGEQSVRSKTSNTAQVIMKRKT